MDKEQAQFILQSFRPGGADAADADFSEALQLAVKDRDLGEWLAEERASDAAFAAALCDLPMPDDLRLHVLAVVRGEDPSDPQHEAEMDALLCDAFSHVDPPDGLRDQILAAMYVQEGELAPTVATAEESENVISCSQGVPWLRVVSIAAAVVLGVFLALQMELGSQHTHEGVIRISSHEVQNEAGHILNTKFALDVMSPPKAEVNTWLVAHKLPAPERLPVGLEGLQVMGCKKIQLDQGVAAALLCFVKSEGGMVHLVVINNDFIADAHLPGLDEVTQGDCSNCPKTGWDSVRWRDRDNTYILFAKEEDGQEAELIQYF